MKFFSFKIMLIYFFIMGICTFNVLATDIQCIYVVETGTTQIEKSNIKSFIKDLIETDKAVDITCFEWQGTRDLQGTKLSKLINQIRRSGKSGEKASRLIILACKRSSNVVANASRELSKGVVIDDIIFLNPVVSENQLHFKPKNFKKLYNIYSQAEMPSTVWGATWRYMKGEDVTARKYQQKEDFNLDTLISNGKSVPVKNIRVLYIKKIEKNVGQLVGQLTDVSTKQMESKDFLLQFSMLIKGLEKSYKLNFDFISIVKTELEVQDANIKEEGPSFVTTKRQLQPAIIINRPVSYNKEKQEMIFKTGDNVQTILPVTVEKIDKFKKIFQSELQISSGKLSSFINLTYKHDFLDRIVKRHRSIEDTGLYDIKPSDVINEKALTDYLNEKSMQSPNLTKTNISEGGKIAYYLTYAPEEAYKAFIKEYEKKDRVFYLNSIIKFLWYCFAEAINKKQGFDEGTYIFRNDNFQRVNNFLGHYQRTFGTDEVEKGGIASSNPFAYPRQSSHFKAEDKKRAPYHYGIDVRIIKDKPALGLLPAGKSHILFGSIEKNQSFFIKPESYGIYQGNITEIFYHGVGLISSTIKKIWDEKKSSMDDYDSNKNYRKERIPKREQCYYGKLKTKILCDKKFIGADNKYNIKFMFEESLREDDDNFREFHKWLTFKYDYPENRYGREVILTDLEFISSIYYNSPNEKVKGIIEKILGSVEELFKLEIEDFEEFKKKSAQKNYEEDISIRFQAICKIVIYLHDLHNQLNKKKGDIDQECFLKMKDKIFDRVIKEFFRNVSPTTINRLFEIFSHNLLSKTMLENAVALYKDINVINGISSLLDEVEKSYESSEKIEELCIRLESAIKQINIFISQYGQYKGLNAFKEKLQSQLEKLSPKKS